LFGEDLFEVVEEDLLGDDADAELAGGLGLTGL
jgi:hypothetical protein